MSSALVSSHTPTLDIPESSNRSTRRTYTRHSRTVKERDRASTSPVDSHASTSTRPPTGIGTRSSASPEKKEKDTADKGKGEEPFLSQAFAPGRSIDSEVLEGEEGEPELDDYEGTLDNITVNGSGTGASIGNEEEGTDVVERGGDAEANRVLEGHPEESSRSPERSIQTIRLVVGRKRTAESSELEEDVELGALTSPPLESDREAEKEGIQIDDDIMMSGNDADGDVLEKLEVDEIGVAKRAPRKKRKWLKKGEIDPDDPIAVARQRERHNMIDEAIEKLNQQEKAVDDGTNSQLVYMFSELERRKTLQHERLQARYDAEMLDLDRLRSFNLVEARMIWRTEKEKLVDEMTADIRHRLSRLNQENICLRRIPHTYPNMRDGRGGGGWEFIPGPLLSRQEEKFVSARVACNKVRRNISLQVVGAGKAEADQDLARMSVRDMPARRSPSPVALLPRNTHSGPTPDAMNNSRPTEFPTSAGGHNRAMKDSRYDPHANILPPQHHSQAVRNHFPFSSQGTPSLPRPSSALRHPQPSESSSYISPKYPFSNPRRYDAPLPEQKTAPTPSEVAFGGTSGHRDVRRDADYIEASRKVRAEHESLLEKERERARQREAEQDRQRQIERNRMLGAWPMRQSSTATLPSAGRSTYADYSGHGHGSDGLSGFRSDDRYNPSTASTTLGLSASAAASERAIIGESERQRERERTRDRFAIPPFRGGYLR